MGLIKNGIVKKTKGLLSHFLPVKLMDLKHDAAAHFETIYREKRKKITIIFNPMHIRIIS
ncbi:hypothetical protein [Cyclobacterium sp. SYSU L10401]|uniref:hypothetical protein n=1 Tax=Cyclobacterium sp. SYSU L10401 TaxID=2678657 RepID=UPI0013D486E4|nr:hypothetical protein [Cyclobacterium sp. SYSU L10401]